MKSIKALFAAAIALTAVASQAQSGDFNLTPDRVAYCAAATSNAAMVSRNPDYHYAARGFLVLNNSNMKAGKIAKDRYDAITDLVMTRAAEGKDITGPLNACVHAAKTNGLMR